MARFPVKRPLPCNRCLASFQTVFFLVWILVADTCATYLHSAENREDGELVTEDKLLVFLRIQEKRPLKRMKGKQRAADPTRINTLKYSSLKGYVDAICKLWR